ncbi:MAG: nuclear transport factor 2 family protein [Bacteroidetes bacterium]|nr:nuclear transport factor 2 family protein [Bacteroidota bacterium]
MFRLLFFGVFLILSCKPTADSFDREEATTEIMALHQEQQQAHLQKDAALLVGQFAEDMISVNRGKVSKADKESSLNRFQSYFDHVDFVKWDDVNQPIIRFSKDGSLAYTVVEKEVVVRFAEGDSLMEEKTIFAWTSIYRRIFKSDTTNNGWKLESMSSTNQPSESQLIKTPIE